MAEHYEVPLALEPMHVACAASWTFLTDFERVADLVAELQFAVLEAVPATRTTFRGTQSDRDILRRHCSAYRRRLSGRSAGTAEHRSRPLPAWKRSVAAGRDRGDAHRGRLYWAIRRPVDGTGHSARPTTANCSSNLNGRLPSWSRRRLPVRSRDVRASRSASIAGSPSRRASCGFRSCEAPDRAVRTSTRSIPRPSFAGTCVGSVALPDDVRARLSARLCPPTHRPRRIGAHQPAVPRSGPQYWRLFDQAARIDSSGGRAAEASEKNSAAPFGQRIPSPREARHGREEASPRPAGRRLRRFATVGTEVFDTYHTLPKFPRPAVFESSREPKSWRVRRLRTQSQNVVVATHFCGCIRLVPALYWGQLFRRNGFILAATFFHLLCRESGTLSRRIGCWQRNAFCC